MRYESTSNLSSLLKDSRIDRAEITLDQYFKSISKKQKKQEALILKLVEEKEIYIKLYLEQKQKVQILTEELDQKVNDLTKVKKTMTRRKKPSNSLEDLRSLNQQQEFSFENDEP